MAGVKNVHNHLAVVLPDEDNRDDAMLTTAANNALTLNVTVPDGAATSAPGPSATRWSAPPGWLQASCKSVTTSTSPADQPIAGTGGSA